MIPVLKELEAEVDTSRIVYGMSLGAVHDDDEATGLTRAVDAGSKVSKYLSYRIAECLKEMLGLLHSSGCSKVQNDGSRTRCLLGDLVLIRPLILKERYQIARV